MPRSTIQPAAEDIAAALGLMRQLANRGIDALVGTDARVEDGFATGLSDEDLAASADDAIKTAANAIVQAAYFTALIEAREQDPDPRSVTLYTARI